MPTPVPAAPPQTRASVAGQFVRGSLGSGVAVGARAVGALVLNKLLAVYGGPGGLTLLAHFQNLLALFTALPNDGVHVGTVKYLAPLRAGSGRYRAWLGAAVAFNALTLLLATGLLLLAPGPLVGVFGQGLGWRLGFALGVGPLIGYSLLINVLLAAGRLRAYVVLTVGLSMLAPAVVAGALLTGAGVPAALLAYLLTQGTLVVPAGWVAYRAGLWSRLRGRLSPAALRGLGRFVLMALSVVLFGKAVDFVLRDVLVARFGLGRTDLWQAVAKLSDNYTMAFAALMSSVYYPRLAALTTQPAALRQYVRTVLLLLAPLLAAGFGLLYGLRDWLLPLLFEPRMAAARDLLGPQLIGDWARFLSWALILLLTARAQVGRYVAVQVSASVMYVGLLALLVPRYGLLGAPLAYAVHFLLLLLGCGVYFRADWRS